MKRKKKVNKRRETKTKLLKDLTSNSLSKKKNLLPKQKQLLGGLFLQYEQSTMIVAYFCDVESFFE